MKREEKHLLCNQKLAKNTECPHAYGGCADCALTVEELLLLRLCTALEALAGKSFI